MSRQPQPILTANRPPFSGHTPNFNGKACCSLFSFRTFFLFLPGYRFCDWRDFCIKEILIVFHGEMKRVAITAACFFFFFLLLKTRAHIVFRQRPMWTRDQHNAVPHHLIVWPSRWNARRPHKIRWQRYSCMSQQISAHTSGNLRLSPTVQSQ